MCMRYFDVWNEHQYWLDIIYMERFLFLVSFSFWSLRNWQFLYLFLLHFGFRFSMKGVLLWCLMGVHVITLALGSQPKQGVTRLRAKRKLGVMSHTPGSARKCEGLHPHTPKATPTWGVGVPVDSRNFRKWLQGLKLLALKSFLYHWKDIET
jgi:hypothetical protein